MKTRICLSKSSLLFMRCFPCRRHRNINIILMSCQMKNLCPDIYNFSPGMVKYVLSKIFHVSHGENYGGDPIYMSASQNETGTLYQYCSFITMKTFITFSYIATALCLYKRIRQDGVTVLCLQ